MSEPVGPLVLDRAKFVAAAVKVFGWTEDYANRVFDEVQNPSREFFRALDDISAHVIAHSEKPKP